MKYEKNNEFKIFFFVKLLIKAFNFRLNTLIIKLKRFIFDSLNKRFSVILIYFKL